MATQESPEIRAEDELLAPFRSAEKPADRWKVGTEQEKCGVHRDGTPVHFHGDRGVAAVLASLVRDHGWTPEREREGGEVIALKKGEASVTLEPGGQLELSGAPLRTVHETRAELEQHMAELRPISDALGIEWLGIGFHPFARREDLEWLPKLRYGVMREYLPTRGSMALDMMLRTCTVQANYDFSSEADALRKVRVALRLSVVGTAMFANSPFVEGKATGERSHRARVWLNVDPDRSGLLPFAWGEAEGSYRRYVEWALDVPMFLLKRDGQVVRNTGQTFRAFLREGFSGHRATHEDWTTHLNTLFPEVRLKRTLEIRGADSAPGTLVPALPALWKGVLYDERALAAAEVLGEKISFAEAEGARPGIADAGLRAKLGRREVAAWAADLLSIAEGGLERIGHRDASGKDERIHLAPLRALVEKADSPADALLRATGGTADPARVIAATKL